MNIYSNEISVFNNWQLQYKPIVQQNVTIVIKYVYAINSDSIMKCCTEAMQKKVKVWLEPVISKNTPHNSAIK